MFKRLLRRLLGIRSPSKLELEAWRNSDAWSWCNSDRWANAIGEVTDVLENADGIVVKFRLYNDQ